MQIDNIANKYQGIKPINETDSTGYFTLQIFIMLTVFLVIYLFFIDILIDKK